MVVLDSFVRFASRKDLRSVAALISEHLFGGIPFMDTKEFDEVPGVCLERTFLGLSVRICGESPEFTLMFDTTLPVVDPAAFPKLEFLNLDAYTSQVLASVPEIQVISV